MPSQAEMDESLEQESRCRACSGGQYIKPPQSCKRCIPSSGSLPASQSSPREEARLSPTAEVSRQVPVPGASSLELGQRKAWAKQQGAGQEEPDGTERGEALVSHTLQTPSQIPRRALFCTCVFPPLDGNKGWGVLELCLISPH